MGTGGAQPVLGFADATASSGCQGGRTSRWAVLGQGPAPTPYSLRSSPSRTRTFCASRTGVGPSDSVMSRSKALALGDEPAIGFLAWSPKADARDAGAPSHGRSHPTSSSASHRSWSQSRAPPRFIAPAVTGTTRVREADRAASVGGSPSGGAPSARCRAAVTMPPCTRTGSSAPPAWTQRERRHLDTQPRPRQNEPEQSMP